MRTTIEIPDHLLEQVKIQAAISGISLRQFLIEALEQKLSFAAAKVRRPPPSPDADAPNDPHNYTPSRDHRERSVTLFCEPQ